MAHALGPDLLPPLLVTFGMSVIIQKGLLEIFPADSRKLDAGAIEIASIRIASDGHVISREIVQKSGNRLMDRSIQAALDRVSFIAPFPAGSENQPRVYLLRFSLQTKRSLG